MTDRTQGIANNLNAIAGLFRKEGRYIHAEQLLEAQSYIYELEKQLKERRMNDDCISREAVLSLPRYCEPDIYNKTVREAIDVRDIEALQSVKLKEGDEG